MIADFEELVATGGERARKGSRLLLGPWDHVSVGLARQGDLQFPGAAGASAAAAKRFFDLHLRGLEEEEGGGKDGGDPRVRWWPAGGDRWLGADSWSGIPREARTLFLQGDGTLRAAAPEGGSVSFTGDPARPVPTLGGANLPPLPHGPTDHGALLGRKDVAAFSTGPLEEPLFLKGRPGLALRFTADRVSTDLCARLCVVGGDGRATLLAEAAQRVEGIRPGEEATALLRFPPVAAEVPKGSGLRLFLSTSNAPRYERNPHTGGERWTAEGSLPVRVEVCLGEAALTLEGVRGASVVGDNPFP